jgi:hypothetical protein
MLRPRIALSAAFVRAFELLVEAFSATSPLLRGANAHIILIVIVVVSILDFPRPSTAPGGLLLSARGSI